ncbi:acetyltransferase, GNAT family [Kutzneria sp. 744]|nr:acetyltransferase, GNAT family [Kutzneria sp. 744]
MSIGKFTIDEARNSDLVDYHELIVASWAVDQPDEPAISYEAAVGRLSTPWPGLGWPIRWSAHVHDHLVGVATAYFPEDENKHLGLLEIFVHPGHRRQGIGTALLRNVIPALQERERTSAEGWGVTQGGAGDSWASSLGFRVAHSVAFQTLDLRAGDKRLWSIEVPDGYVLRLWADAAPDDLVESYSVARAAIHDSPLGDAGYRFAQWSVDRVREAEAERRKSKVEQMVVVAVHKESGTVAALTELALHPHRRDVAFQGETAVIEAHRGLGLGRCIKGRMIRWLRSDRPEFERILTTTASENAGMINVNRQVGFIIARTTLVVNCGIGELEAML